MKLTVFLVLMILIITPLYGNNISDNLNINANLTRHYDPQHPGHYHKCANCGKLYHQAGDLYPGSPGSNRCPYCGFINVTPPSNNNGNYPPSYPPNQPIPYPNPGNITADQVISHARSAYDSREKNRILYDGARRIRDARGIIRISVEATDETTTQNILRELDRYSQLTNYPDIYFLENYYNRYSSNRYGDEMLLHANKFLTSIRDLMRVVVKFYYADNAYKVLNRIERRDNVENYIYINDVRSSFYSISSFDLADRLLISVMRYFNSKDYLRELSNMAHYQNTKRMIDDYASHLSGWFRTSLKFRSFLNRIKTKDDNFYLDKGDISIKNISKIENFSKLVKNGKIKSSSRLTEKIKEVKEFLKSEYLKTKDSHILEILNNFN